MNKPLPFLLVLLSSLAVSQLRAGNPGPAIGPRPSWVNEQTLDASRHEMDADADEGSIDLLYDNQVNLQDNTVYFHKATRILTESGVQNGSEISVSYDPTYNKLVFHSIHLIRGRQVINKLQPGRFRIIQQENDLSRYLYNGSLSAVLILDDVRKGDIIEYSYSLIGFNPVFAGKYDERWPTRFEVPVYQLHYSIIAPLKRSLRIRNYLEQVACSRKKEGRLMVYDWKLGARSALHAQDELPEWYDPFPAIQITEYQTWNEVSRWARELFPPLKKFTPHLKSRLEIIRNGHQGQVAQFLAALRFVQDDIRYMGVEMGENSHRPNDPAKVLDQRFGDCKDKAYLLVTLAQGLGVNAQPVLVATAARRTLRQWLPSVTAFDHVVVRAELNGLYYWFDPTISYQRGNLDDIDFPDYGCGLVVGADTRDLTDIPRQMHGMVSCKETFSIPDLSGNARLVVRTEYSGSFADQMRSDFHTNSIYNIRQRFQEYYGNYFEHISIDSLSWKDEEPGGKLLTWEYYSIQQLWEAGKKRNRIFLAPFVIDGVLKKPKETARKMPFALNYPARYREEVEVRFPADWQAPEFRQQVKDAAFNFQAKASYINRNLRLTYEYESLQDYVSPEEADEYFARYREAGNAMRYEVVINDTASAMPYSSSLPRPAPARSGGRLNTQVIIWILPAFTLLLAFLLFWWGKRTRQSRRQNP